MMEAQVALLRELYERHLDLHPEDSYLREHSSAPFITGTVRTFRFYEPWLPEGGRFLDWGCRHAVDACLIRKKFGEGVKMDACDVMSAENYGVFHGFARICYERLGHPYLLPYPDAAFNAVIASGVLEHVPFDYESLKELYRVLKPAGRLVVTYLPNASSVEEWRLRRRKLPAHLRLYTVVQLRALLLHGGFRPLVVGHQNRLDLLPADRAGTNWVRLGRVLGLQRLGSCLCAVSEKTASF